MDKTAPKSWFAWNSFTLVNVDRLLVLKAFPYVTRHLVVLETLDGRRLLEQGFNNEEEAAAFLYAAADSFQ